MSRTAIAAILAICCTPSVRSDDLAWLDAYNVAWTTTSKHAGESMPVSGGDIGLNVWVENDELLFYMGRAGYRDENGALKIGRSKRMDALSKDELAYLAGKARLPERLVLDTAAETVSRFHEAWAAEKANLPISKNVAEAIEANVKTVPLASE